MAVGKPGLRKYAVRVSGTGWRVRIGTSGRATGFFATRFVEAHDKDEAGLLGIELVRRDLQNYENLTPEECSLSIDEVWEDTVGFEQHAPGAGFTWY